MAVEKKQTAARHAPAYMRIAPSDVVERYRGHEIAVKDEEFVVGRGLVRLKLSRVRSNCDARHLIDMLHNGGLVA